MIAKISKNISFKPVVDYHISKVIEGEAIILDHSFRNIDETNIDKTTSKTITNYFEECAILRPSCKTKMSHISLSFHPDELVSKEKMKDISQDYLEKMGYDNSNYFIVQHFDKEYQHLHIVTSRIDFYGDVVKDSNDFISNNRVCRELEKKHSLIEVSEILGTKKEQSQNEHHAENYKLSIAIKQNFHKTDEKFQCELREIYGFKQIENRCKKKHLSDSYIKDLIGDINFNNILNKLNSQNLIYFSKREQLETKLLKHYDLSYDRNDFLNRLKNDNIYSRAINEKGKLLMQYGDKEIGIYINEKKLSEKFSQSNLQEFDTQKYKLTDLTYQKNVLTTVVNMGVSKARNVEHLDMILKANRVEMKTHSNSRGIYGVDFKHLDGNGHVFKGSQLGVSWNVIEKKLAYNNIYLSKYDNKIENDIPVFDKKEIEKEVNQIPNLSKLGREMGENRDTEYEKYKRRAEKRDKENDNDMSMF